MKNIEEIAALLVEQRKKLGIEQKDMYMRIGMKQQQYQRIEAGSDVKLSTLLRVLEGLDLELSIVSKGESVTFLPVESVLGRQSELGKGKSGLEDDADDLGFWFEPGDNS
ncbi:helix-turn-helix domain-containing protein [Vibrio anguillarum]|uniref:Helix-turn-helix domain-containing protein n=3 Tax=Vibrio anguillarum TaxID=55601 RepID=A0ABR9Z5G4_VIBAN|nr:helix-turn-helix domain-containing protein [Vibrio anguillarum]MBF4373341.1 helix-turn-helix domain-containing protein [Vibrio anguillarum]